MFHDHKAMVALLLEHKADPYMRNAYHKSAFDLAQPELDEKNKRIMQEHWERENKPAEGAPPVPPVPKVVWTPANDDRRVREMAGENNVYGTVGLCKTV